MSNAFLNITPEVVSVVIETIQNNYSMVMEYNEIQRLPESNELILLSKLPYSPAYDIFNRIVLQFFVYNYGQYNFSCNINNTSIQLLYDIYIYI